MNAGHARRSPTSSRPPEAPSLKPTKRRSLTDEIVDQLLALISSSEVVELVLPSERELATQLEVSRPSVREALSALAHLGVLDVRGKVKYGKLAAARATLVARHVAGGRERELVTDPLEVRRMLEPEIAAVAAKRATEEAIDEISIWFHRMERAVERGDRVVEYDSAFHVAIASASGNSTLTQFIKVLTDAFRDSRELSFWPEDGATRALDDHRLILDAIRSRNPRIARQAMRRHIDHVEKRVRSMLVIDGYADTTLSLPGSAPDNGAPQRSRSPTFTA